MNITLRVESAGARLTLTKLLADLWTGSTGYSARNNWLRTPTVPVRCDTLMAVGFFLHAQWAPPPNDLLPLNLPHRWTINRRTWSGSPQRAGCLKERNVWCTRHPAHLIGPSAPHTDPTAKAPTDVCFTDHTMPGDSVDNFLILLQNSTWKLTTRKLGGMWVPRGAACPPVLFCEWPAVF